MQEYKTLDQAKKVYANESASELALFDYPIIEELIKWLDDNGRDGSYADYLYELGSGELRCLMAEARAEFGLAQEVLFYRWHSLRVSLDKATQTEETQ